MMKQQRMEIKSALPHLALKCVPKLRHTEINMLEKYRIYWLSERKCKIIILYIIEKSLEMGNTNYEVTT